MHESEVKKTLERIKSIDNMVNSPLYDLESPETYEVHISVDNKIEHGLFKPDPKRAGAYLASEQTFRAMKKNIFTVTDPDELKMPYQCLSCKTDLDKQFWEFCPYCGEKFVKD